MNLKLRDILKTDKQGMSDVVVIEYRSHFEDEDLLNGYGEYHNGQLRSLDKDTEFSLDDEFVDYEWDSVDFPNDSLVVWDC